MEKDCSKCHQRKSEDEFSFDKTRKTLRSQCRACVRSAQRRYERRDPATIKARKDEWAGANREYWRKHRLRSKYGLSIEQYEQLCIQQQHRCAICSETPDVLVVDHDHATGTVRGLLCNACNLMLGKAADRVDILQAAILYLVR